MTLVFVVWIEIFLTLALRWLVMNERLDQTFRARESGRYLARDELTDLLVKDPKTFARTAPSQWLKGLSARTQTSTDAVIEQQRTRGNRGYLAVVAYLFLGTPLVLAIAGILGRASMALLAATFLALQGALLSYWLRRLWSARQGPKPDALTTALSIAGICAVVIGALLGAFLLTSAA
jgi:hypothetical protein